jgi:MYXO-CTERM domain-containing protein
MKRLLTPLLIALAAVQTAQAGPLWGYRSPGNTNVLTPGSDAGLTFPNTSWTDTDGGGSIVVTPVQQWSVALATDPDKAGGDYTFGLEVIDYASGMSGLVDFAGTLDGTIWKEGTALTNTFTGETTKSLDLGDFRYTVALDAFENPTGFGEEGAGKITADVTITALDDPVPVPTTPPVVDDPDPPAAQTPEPTTAVMGVIGLGAVAFARLRRRRNVEVA